ncbi:MAG: hypothetical protein M1827_006404 [Pycnora praestabilis]|nr:MAG: hypothetical protein M1827_006404 [Pycnora praestabilis]
MSAERPSHNGFLQDSSAAPLPSSTSTARNKQVLPPALVVPSFSAFRARVSSVSAASPVRRKPLPATASSLATRFSPSDPVTIVDRSRPKDSSRSVSIDIPPLHNSPSRSNSSPRPSSASSPFVLRDLDRNPRGQTPVNYPNVETTGQAPFYPRSESPKVDDRVSEGAVVPAQTQDTYVQPTNDFDESKTNSASLATRDEDHNRNLGRLNKSPAMSLHPPRPHPNLTLHLDAHSRRSFSNHSHDSCESTSTSKPKSPGQKLTSFFTWKASSPGAESSATTLSDKSHSPTPSPLSPKSSLESSPPVKRALQPVAEMSKAAAIANGPLAVGSKSSLPPRTPTPIQVKQVEDELREISADLAGSIRREMDLEDMVERLQSEASQVPDSNRRTSDYFSDSGISSARYPLGEGDTKTEEMEKTIRRAEQEKAQLRVESSQKVQTERARRKVLESQVRSLEQRIEEVDYDQIRSSDANARVKELESSLDDARRRLSNERQVKENLEDLLTALRGEIEQHRNERDNLRDEVAPHLRARVEGLETEAAEHQKLTYENTRMQQELQSLRNENTTLVNARKMQLEMQQQQQRYNSIAEEEEPAVAKVDLTRSNSLARGSIMRGGRPGMNRSHSVTRSISVKERESRDSLADRVRDIEAQRDALHKALKSLLDRQEFQNRDATKRIRALEAELDRALSDSPRRGGYDREVSHLRREINQLRRRADDALEQKWQCEKGLSGLKMDLDRAEQETGSLRTLLQEHDILVPELPGKSPKQENQTNGPSTSASLEKTYKELQTTHALSIARVRQLQGGALPESIDTDTKQIMELLRQSISDAEAERDYAQRHTEAYRLHAQYLENDEEGSIGEEQDLANQLFASAGRVEDLAVQVQQQLTSNNSLRQRLADAIGRGENEQKTSAARINEMQGKLKTLEDKVMAAQQHTEDTVARHEDEVRNLKESQSTQLLRLKTGIVPPPKLSPKSPRSPLFVVRSPRLDYTTSGLGMSMVEASKTEFLERKVEDLERALGIADKEMEEVVSRMNMAQIEVMELQSERDEATRQTRKLQNEISSERDKVKALMA